MSYEDRELRSIFTFSQDTTPGDPDQGDTWWHTGQCRGYFWNGASWQDWELVTDPEAWEGVAGYLMGAAGTTVFTTVCHKLYFANESITTLASGLTQARNAAGVSAENVGYGMGGGTTLGSFTRIDKLTFASDSITSISSGTLTTGANSTTLFTPSYGYLAGGVNSSIDRLDFSDETVITLGFYLSWSGYSGGGMQNMINGYYQANVGWSGPQKVDRLTFSPEVTSTMSVTLGNLRNGAAAASSYAAGYAMGGWYDTSGVKSHVQKILFSSETVSSQGSVLSVSDYARGGFNSRVSGYACSGYTVSNCDKVVFDSDTYASVYSTLTFAGGSQSRGLENLSRP